jgi:fatty-acyl-CoA synthase
LIRLRQGETMSDDDVRAFCQGQIAHQKIPRHIRFVNEFPMTVTGKVQKFIMRQQVEEQLGVKRQETA